MPINNKVKFKVFTLGCKVNQYDSATLANLLSPKLFFYSEDKKSGIDDKTNLVIINSCAVTKSAINKSRRLISSSKNKYPRAKIALIGCWPKIYEINNLAIDFIFSERDLLILSKKIEEEFYPTSSKDVNKSDSTNKDINKCNSINKNKVFEHNDGDINKTRLNLIEDRSRYFIKIQDGCEQFCSYCVIPLARGSLKSRPIKDILSEIELSVKNGFQEVVLSGIHLGLYGKDFKDNRKNLTYLLKKVLQIKSLGRIRLSSIEINEVSDELINLIANNKKICQHLHISLQSGNDKILKLMNRPYDSKYFLERVKKIREVNPDMAITTDIIVGFPGESKSDFKDTYEFAKKIKFSKIHVFSFSAHERAPAFKFPKKVSPEDIRERSFLLRSLSKDLELDYKKIILKKNKDFNLVVEGFAPDGIRAKSQFYFDFKIPYKKIDQIEEIKKFITKNDLDKILKNKDVGNINKLCRDKIAQKITGKLIKYKI